ncbi:MAG: Asp-tRNA(Asn)/Glu-tRNA(Gln) amidotransferase GatCAB subunit B, partial [Ginsengibacter sp.]
PDEHPLTIAEQLNIIQQNDEEAINKWIDDTISSMPDKVAQYKKGKKNLIGLFAGDIRRKSNGKADMVHVNKLLVQKLNQ